MARRTLAPQAMKPVGYHPPAGYGLALEILSLSELRRRVSADYLRSPERIAFHMLICVTQGHCTHMVDFDTVACRPGSLLTLRPGQIQRFDTASDWNGWLVLFRPEFLFPLKAVVAIDDLETYGSLEALPMSLSLSRIEHRAIVQSIVQMSNDAKLRAPPKQLDGLLRQQLYALLMRLHLFQHGHANSKEVVSINLQRFRRYRQLVEREFSRLHRVADYANLLGCSAKSLSRATWDVVGMAAKVFLAERIALEAKRLLAHTAAPVSAIADQLGFDEATNFVKFFKRAAGCRPGDFRRRQ